MSLSAAEMLQATFDDLVARHGPPVTHARGPVVDDAWNREHFTYVAAIADATGLDFVQLAMVELQTGNYGVSKILAGLAPERRAEAERIQAVHRLASGLHEAEAAAYLRTLADDSLSETAQRERYLDAFVASWSLRTASMPSNGFPDGAYPASAKASAATGLDYQKLATIEYKGGRSGLKRTLERIPDLPNRGSAIS